MASVLHDNPRSKTEKKSDEKPDEKTATEKKAAEKAKPEEKKPEGEGKKPEGEEGVEETMSPKDKFMEGMQNIQKRHEGERRDFHGNQKEAMRQMQARHGKEIADHFDLGMRDGGAPGEGEVAAAPVPAASGSGEGGEGA